jgi:hypothetical protein
MIQSRRMRSARHVACMGEMRNTYKILAGTLKSCTIPGDMKNEDIRKELKIQLVQNKTDENGQIWRKKTFGYIDRRQDTQTGSAIRIK